jgi:hypothetical protein
MCLSSSLSPLSSSTKQVRVVRKVVLDADIYEEEDFIPAK